MNFEPLSQVVISGVIMLPRRSVDCLRKNFSAMLGNLCLSIVLVRGNQDTAQIMQALDVSLGCHPGLEDKNMIRANSSWHSKSLGQSKSSHKRLTHSQNPTQFSSKKEKWFIFTVVIHRASQVRSLLCLPTPFPLLQTDNGLLKFYPPN